MTQGALVWIEQFQGRAASASWEALRAARTLAPAGPVIAAVFGQGVGDVAQEAIRRGADTVLVADDATLADTASSRMSRCWRRSYRSASPLSCWARRLSRGGRCWRARQRTWAPDC